MRNLRKYKDINTVMVKDKSLKDILDEHAAQLEREALDPFVDLLLPTSRDFKDEDFSNVRFKNVDLSNIVFRHVKFDHALFDGCTGLNCVFEECDLSHCEFINCNFYNSTFIDCATDPMSITCSNFRECRFHRITVHGIYENNAFDKAKFCSLKFIDAWVYNCNFTEATFDRCINVKAKNGRYRLSVIASIFHLATITSCDLREVGVVGCSLINARIKNTNLSNQIVMKTSFAQCLLSADNVGENLEYRKGRILSESIIGYKQGYSECNKPNETWLDNGNPRIPLIITFEVPKGAVVFSPDGHVFRTNTVKVLSIEDREGHSVKRAYSEETHTSYYVGDEITVKDFSLDSALADDSEIRFYTKKLDAVTVAHDKVSVLPPVAKDADKPFSF